MDATYGRMMLNWDRGLQSLMRVYKINDYIEITSKHAREELCYQGNKSCNMVTRRPI